MTKAEIRDYIKEELAKEEPEIYLDADDYKVILEALSVNPCKDCASRAAVKAMEEVITLKSTQKTNDKLLNFIEDNYPTAISTDWEKGCAYVLDEVEKIVKAEG